MSLARTLLAVAAGATLSMVASAQSGGNAAPFGVSTPIRGQYIVVFKDSVTNPQAQANAMVQAAGGRLLHSYAAAIKGFAAQLPDAAVSALQNNPNVAYVEQDQTVALSSTTQSPATWGLDRIDARSGLDNSYTYNYSGTGVTAFIIDTGIADHDEFGSRLDRSKGYDAIGDGRGTVDCNGHGTHVAGTVGGTTYGVAKSVTLVPIRVLNCRGSGTWSGVIAGVNAAANAVATYNLGIAVGNMSLGGGKSTAVNDAVAGAVNKGVVMAVAAGNDGANACNYSPASTPSAITVGATTSSDARASYSNYGTCVDVFAPGSSITSAWSTSTSATNTISGTSMATPHVTGVAALSVQASRTAQQTPTPASVTTAILSSATANAISGAGTGSPNLMLYSLLEPASSTVIVSSSITGTAVVSKRYWRAQVTIEIRSKDTNLAAANITVAGKFDGVTNAQCVTGSNGKCSVTSPNMAKVAGSSTTFTVETATGTNVTFDAGYGNLQYTVTYPN